ncbi:MAG: hypothetical protein COY80_03230 [Candidatus Pacebacteria bacterium CG_4_10_14_0_8_um_filter_42_14]|nr:MAG: hypothetical protein COY80_03230 [Candidatus Pacebacteria bacterium CG_4_10_14_0_8_um_filter_42_14]
MKISSINPATNQKNGELEVSSKQEIEKKFQLAKKAKLGWQETPIKERVAALKKVRDVFKNHEEEIAKIITKEIGTPITECRGEVAWDWSYFDWFIDNAESSLSPKKTYEDENSIHEIWYEPYGVVAVITPWNLPFDMFIWSVIPNLLAGNVVIYKASEECILSGKLLADIMEEAELPGGVFQAVHGNAEQGKQLVQQEIDMIWFTGSYAVGHELYKIAADKFIKAVLELGGSNPSIILADANIDHLLSSLIFKRFMFSGQTCDALKRLIVHKSVAEELIEKLSLQIKLIVVGDPTNEKTKMGPLVSKKQLATLESQVEDALNSGATILAQSSVPEGEGAYFPATLLGNVTQEMRVWKEEVFGPVLPVVTFSTDEEAIKLANDTPYGLGSQVFTSDHQKALDIAALIQAGNVDINGVGHFKPSSPFGGYKKSGTGREHGEHGFQELTQIKLVARPKRKGES